MTSTDSLKQLDYDVDHEPTVDSDTLDRRVDLKGLLPDELRELLSSLGKERFRSNQLLRWMHSHGVSDFDLMTDLSAKFRLQLPTFARIENLREVTRISTDDGATTKLLLELRDGMRIETVAMNDDGRRTVCVSSQVGCALGCDFCATGQLGLKRNLTTGEIVDQLIHAARVFTSTGELRPEEKPITNVVLMGMGEPLHNYDNVLRAIKLMRLEMGLAISTSKVTISTVGLVPMIRRLADDLPKVGLAISLNATTDDVRSEIMPVNKRWPIAELIDAAKYMSQRAERRWVTFEYALIAGVNDSDVDARRLVSLLSGFPCKINLIPFNPVPGREFERPSRERIEQFNRILWDKHITVTVRWSKGDDIGAACGQLQAQTPA
jgi:23S rRNA (adenine2503-C2)-methyltransferase